MRTMQPEKVLSAEERADIFQEFRGKIMEETKVEVMRMHGLPSEDLMHTRVKLDKLESKLRAKMNGFDDD